MIRALLPGLVIAGTAIGLVGLGAIVFARLFQWLDDTLHGVAVTN